MIFDPLWLAGAVWALFCGWALSSYTSNFIFRLPRGEYPFGREPYCGDCNASLTARDLAPIISYYMTDGKCRHCGAQVPMSYFLLELIVPLAALWAYGNFGLGDYFLLFLAAASTLLAIAMMAWEDGYYSPLTTVFLGGLGLLVQALFLHEITGALLSALIAFLLAVKIHLSVSHQSTASIPDVQNLPREVWFAVICGCWLPIIPMLGVLALWFVLSHALKPLFRNHPHARIACHTIAFCLSLSAGMLWYYSV